MDQDKRARVVDAESIIEIETFLGFFFLFLFFIFTISLLLTWYINNITETHTFLIYHTSCSLINLVASLLAPHFWGEESYLYMM